MAETATRNGTATMTVAGCARCEYLTGLWRKPKFCNDHLPGEISPRKSDYAMTLDDVAALMRERFTTSRGAPVTIAAEEWNAMAEGIYIADKLEQFLANPHDDKLADAAAALIKRVRTGR